MQVLLYKSKSSYFSMKIILAYIKYFKYKNKHRMRNILNSSTKIEKKRNISF